MKTKKIEKLSIEPRVIFEMENGWPDDYPDDPTTTLATITFTHLIPPPEPLAKG